MSEVPLYKPSEGAQILPWKILNSPLQRGESACATQEMIALQALI